VPPDLDGLPAALTTARAAELLGLSSSALERAARRGDAPVPFYRWGRALRWPSEPIRRLLLGLEPLNDDGAPARGPADTISPTILTRDGAKYVITRNANSSKQ
jgi:hypothetical protein